MHEFTSSMNYRLVKFLRPLEVVLERAFAADRLADASGLHRAIVNASSEIVEDGAHLAKTLSQIRQRTLSQIFSRENAYAMESLGGARAYAPQPFNAQIINERLRTRGMNDREPVGLLQI